MGSSEPQLTTHGLSLADGSLGVDGTYIPLSKISVVSFLAKRLPLWPGIVLAIWSAGVFANDMMPAARGVEQNSPFFKLAILLAATGWFVARAKLPSTFVVNVTVDGAAKEVARCRDIAEAREIAEKIRKAVSG